jgi:aspartyl-tRNA(Asn)/glutamyl-tRNA(Gln) amidotransferase subunit A
MALFQAYRSDLKISALDSLPASARAEVPLHNRAVQSRPPREADDARLTLPEPAAWPITSAHLAAAYASKKTTPREVVVKALDAARRLAGMTPSVGPLYRTTADVALEEADRATARYKKGEALGPLDGVPYAVKEQTAVRGLPRQGGTAFLPDAPQPDDATCIARLRAAGAIVIGTTPMTEYGMSPMGQNAKRSMPKNPHDPSRLAGGSSTGSGVAVATGLVPFAIGADGGGSIRIPSAMNGVFGIKPTWGRVSRAGDISTGTVAHVGPLASSTADLARVLEAIGAPDPLDTETSYAPPIDPGSLVRALGRGVRGLRIAVDDAEWADASEPVARAGREAMRALEKAGAVLVPVRLELARHAPALGYLSIGLETRAILRAEWETNADDMGLDLQVTMGVLAEVAALDYVDAQRLRNGLRRELATMYESVDLLALPSTVDTAALATEREMASGFVDAKVLGNLCRFMFLANLSGLPASSSPIGLDASGLPIGFQLVGDAFDEATVLAATAHLERLGVAEVRRPRVSVEIL